MKTLRYSILYYFSTILIGELKYVKGLPSDYCLPKPNLDDCGETPTQVFSYYHPGSRCEIEMWRGCPSMNVFDNEYTCSHHCIGRLWGDLDSDENVIAAKDPDEEPEAVENECEISINTTDCGKDPIEVYTYDSVTKTCIKAEWNGCETKNKFDDEVSCYKACGGDNWEEKIKKLPIEDVEEIDKILDNVIEEQEKEAVEEPEADEEPEAAEVPEPAEVPENVLLKQKKKVEVKETTEHNEEAVTTPEEITTPEAATDEPTTEVPTTTEDEIGQADEIVTT